MQKKQKKELSEDQMAMLRLKKGESEALEELIQRHQQPLSNFFRKLGGSISDSEDLIQETFIRVYKSSPQYEVKAKFTTFLYMLARHTWIDFFRRQNRRITTTTEVPLELVSDDLQQVEKMEMSQDTQSILNKLPQKYREVVVLSFFMKFKYAEIATLLDIPIGTVRSRLHEAVKRLKGIWPREEMEHD